MAAGGAAAGAAADAAVVGALGQEGPAEAGREQAHTELRQAAASAARGERLNLQRREQRRGA